MASIRAVLVLKILFIMFIIVHRSRSAENVALTGFAQQSVNQDPRWTADKAIDNCIIQVIGPPPHCCAHTATNYKQAWWRVDLGQTITIQYITIYYRDNSGYRFGGYYLYVSNSTNPIQDTLCYQDNSSLIGEVNFNPTHLCPYVARYVTVYNYRGVPKRHDWYSDDAVLELCEVQVFGCQIGSFGYQNCNNPCSESCYGGNCDATTGACFYCFHGMFGDFCKQHCSTNCSNTCEKDTGHCTDCIPGMFGDFCEQRCSTNCIKTCEKDTGHCTDCIPGMFGDFCEQHCSTNCNNTCQKDSGHCIGCKPGKRGDFCDAKCSPNCVICHQTTDLCYECINGKYGDMCDQDCSDNCKDKSCLKDNGYCLECVPGKYGDDCTADCPDNCKDICVRTNKHCIGCIPGKTGDLCAANCSSNCVTCNQTSEQCFDCTVGKYGWLCNNSCSETCLNNVCNPRNGTCEETMSQEQQLGNTGIIVGVVVAGLLLVIAITITVLLMRRRRQNSAKQDSFDDISRNNVSRTSRRNDGYEQDDTETMTGQGNVYEVLDIAETESMAGQGNVNANVENMENEILTNNVYVNAVDVDKDNSRTGFNDSNSTCITISDMKTLVRTKMLNKAKAFEDEYLELPSGAIHEHNIGMLDKNRQKNRFKSTFSYDHSRVILDKLDDDPHSDYINANYIDSVISPAKYIATQGPIDKTVDDLWRMIWQLKSGKIVMLTNLIEGTKKKCEKYWPDEGEPMFTKHFEVVLDRERVYAFYVIRDIILTEKKTKLVRQIHQFHYTTWPDHGTPDPNELVVFHRRVKHYKEDLPGKMVVHCSAGVGRTGTFIALDALLENCKVNGVVDVIGYIRTMRKDRVNMVQTCDQYIAIHNLLIEAFDIPDTLVPRMKYHTTLKCLCDDAPVNQTKLWGEYKLIQDIKPAYTENDYKTATLPDNRNKNRDPNVLAADKFRAYLSSFSVGRTDYINAVEIPSYTSRSGYIVTQTPLKDTVVDLLTLIMDQDCDTVVIIEDDQVKWLPEENIDKSIGSFKLRHEGGSSNLTNVDLIDISISNQEQRYDARIRVFHCTGWDRHVPIPPDFSGLLQLLELLDSRRRSNGSKKTIVMCRDGYSQSGLFCRVSNARDQMKIDEEVDIFQIVRQLLFRRPEFITNYDQYKGCYQMIKEYLDTTDVYMN